MSTTSFGLPIRPRGSLKRRLSEFLLRKSLARQSFPASPRKSLGPSVNPVRKSVADAGNPGRDEFVVHYNRKLHSHLTIDANHEAYYEKVGLPKKPQYNPHGRRFSGSSETDRDYDKDEFQRQATVLNNRPSLTDTIRSNSIASSDASTKSQGSPRSKPRNSDLATPTAQRKSGSVSSSVDSRRSSRSSRKDIALSKYQSIAIARREAGRNEESSCLKPFIVCIRFCICCTRPKPVGPARINRSLTEPETMDDSMTSSFTAVGGDKANKANPRRTSFSLGITPSLAVLGGDKGNKSEGRRSSTGSAFSSKFGDGTRRKSGT